jgi:uncharacterized protein (DUF362 family)
MGRERVAVVRVVEQRIDEALEALLGLLGGLEGIVPQGSRVLVKPNFTFAPTDRGITHPELVEGVVRMVAARSPREIVIAEGAGDTYTSQAFRFQGIYRIAARYGARVVDLNLEPGVRVAVPESLGRAYVMVPEVVTQCDVMISIPVFKLWSDNPLSLSLKNLFGLYGARCYGYNKNSRTMVERFDFYGLPGEVGEEQPCHEPTVAQSVCAMNLAAPTHLAIIDALEGGDGTGNWIRLDTLVAGRNAVATDTVGMAMAGLAAEEYPTFKLCAEHGLGPCRMDEIEMVGLPLANVSFSLERLRGNVLEMPARFCLRLLSTMELDQIHRAFQVYGLLPAHDSDHSVGRASVLQSVGRASASVSTGPTDGVDDAHGGIPIPQRRHGDAGGADREALIEQLAGILEGDGFIDAALRRCGDHALNVLALIVEKGGTAGDLEEVRHTFSQRCGGNESIYYAPAARTLTRLGLVYVVDSACRSYYLLAEGVVEAFARVRKGQAAP